MTEKKFKREYPNANLSRFLFDTLTLNEEGDTETGVYLIDGDKYVDVTTDEFKNNPEYTKWLYSKKGEPLYPRLWLGKGTTQPLQKGAHHPGRRSKWTAKIEGEYTETWPKRAVLDYPVNNFRVFVNGKEPARLCRVLRQLLLRCQRRTLDAPT